VDANRILLSNIEQKIEQTKTQEHRTPYAW
jgi:hypothetical protein